MPRDAARARALRPPAALLQRRLDAAALPPSEYQRRLREARVLILGLGGLGSWASYALAVLRDRRARCCWTATGSRRATSTGRSSIASATSAARRPRPRRSALAEFDSSCRLMPVARRLESVDAVRRRCAGVDFVVNGADWPAHDIERWVNAACFELGVPFITMSHSPPVARVGPLYVPGTTGCFACQEHTYREELPALRRARGAAPRPALRGGHARPGVRVHRRPGGARDAPPAHRPVPAGVARHGARLRPAHDGGEPGAGPAPRGLRGLRRIARDQSRAAPTPHALAGARLGPEARDVVACRREVRPSPDSPRRSVRGRTYVRRRTR